MDDGGRKSVRTPWRAVPAKPAMPPPRGRAALPVRPAGDLAVRMRWRGRPRWGCPARRAAGGSRSLRHQYRRRGRPRWGCPARRAAGGSRSLRHQYRRRGRPRWGCPCSMTSWWFAATVIPWAAWSTVVGLPRSMTSWWLRTATWAAWSTAVGLPRSMTSWWLRTVNLGGVVDGGGAALLDDLLVAPGHADVAVGPEGEDGEHERPRRRPGPGATAGSSPGSPPAGGTWARWPRWPRGAPGPRCALR